MAHFQSQYEGAHRQTDEYGNPIAQKDEYGNPIHHPSATGTHGASGYAASVTNAAVHGGTPVAAGTEHHKEHHGATGMLHRSGSSSSSSSEDDGEGGRRKKGSKKKILGTGHKDHHAHERSATEPGAYHSTEECHEKKGIMDKIKEKLPGHN